MMNKKEESPVVGMSRVSRQEGAYRTVPPQETRDAGGFCSRVSVRPPPPSKRFNIPADRSDDSWVLHQDSERRWNVNWKPAAKPLQNSSGIFANPSSSDAESISFPAPPNMYRGNEHGNFIYRRQMRR
ncbi:hypothetical protein Bbelb_230030 [Branchiostoma belcheri]|nr:hypothetical protein Bbelb_230030 [Branchiostoma belcheri]